MMLVVIKLVLSKELSVEVECIHYYLPKRYPE